MAAAKPEVFTCHFINTILIRISPLLDEIATTFLRLLHVVWVREPKGDRADAAGNQKCKMAANKSEVRISQLLGKIGTPFQRLSPHFWGPVI